MIQLRHIGRDKTIGRRSLFYLPRQSAGGAEGKIDLVTALGLIGRPYFLQNIAQARRSSNENFISSGGRWLEQ